VSHTATLDFTFVTEENEANFASERVDFSTRLDIPELVASDLEERFTQELR